MIKNCFAALKYHFEKWDNLALFAWAFFVSVTNTLYTGPDFFWDTLNYHVYNAYAALHNRIAVDIIPNGVHAFFNPNADFWYYALLRGFNSFPVLAILLQAVWFTIGLFFTLKILQLALPKRSFHFFSILTMSLLFLYTPAIFAWGSINTGDMAACCFLLISLYCLFAALKEETKPRLKMLLAAGAAYGMSFSLKYTVAPFLTAYVVMFAFCFRSFRQWIKSGFWFALAAVSTFLATSGWWLYKLYVHFKNPFFNALFQSPYFDPVNLVDKRFFVGNSLVEILSLPFILLGSYKMHGNEGYARTYLYFAYLLAAIILAVYYYQHRHRKSVQTVFQKIWRPLIIFVVTGLFLWVVQFSIIRYVMPIEAAGAVLLTITFFTCIKGKRKILFIGMLSGLLAFPTIIFKKINSFPNQLLEVSYKPLASGLYVSGIPEIKDGAVVILQGWRLSFLIPFLNPKASYVGGLQPNFEDYELPEERLTALNFFASSPLFFQHKFAPLIHQKIQAASDVYVLLFETQLVMPLHQVYPLKQYGVEIEEKQCTKIQTNWGGWILLCKATKI